MAGELSSALADLLAQPRAGEAALVDALRMAAATTAGPDWREQSWDSYRYDTFALEEWCVAVPFGALRHAHDGVVPVAAAERLLALPDKPPERPWERQAPGPVYRPYWTRDKRFLSLVADIAARFPGDSPHVTRGLLRITNRLHPRDRAAVELHCASLGLLPADPLALAREVLASAGRDDLGARGELVLHALHRVDSLPDADRAAVLSQATAVSRRTTAFIASNPFAACVEALARADVDSVAELLELVERAAKVKVLDWQGWEQALHAAGRATTHLAVQGGLPVVRAVVDGLRRWQRWLPGLEPWILTCGARGLTGPEQAETAHRAMLASRRAAPSALGLRAEVGAARLLALAGAEGSQTELRYTLQRLLELPSSRPQQLGLSAAVVALAPCSPAAWAGAERAARALRHGEARWLALIALATAPTAPETSGCLDAARRGLRWWRLRRPPLDAVVPLFTALAPALGPRHPALAALAELARLGAEGEHDGNAFGERLMALGPCLAEPAAAAALAAYLDGLRDSWWRLPLLALLADAVAVWLHGPGSLVAVPAG